LELLRALLGVRAHEAGGNTLGHTKGSEPEHETRVTAGRGCGPHTCRHRIAACCGILWVIRIALAGSPCTVGGCLISPTAAQSLEEQAAWIAHGATLHPVLKPQQRPLEVSGLCHVVPRCLPHLLWREVTATGEGRVLGTQGLKIQRVAMVRCRDTFGIGGPVVGAICNMRRHRRRSGGLPGVSPLVVARLGRCFGSRRPCCCCCFFFLLLVFSI